ncbi:unnamed protein product [Orchesella dallaii]|uniref:SF3 helicase domain-containing protein n=1 Tax=Orchesella dallaii TaxID=48710 RepID=A0ABP1RH01_9HEXA
MESGEGAGSGNSESHHSWNNFQLGNREPVPINIELLAERLESLFLGSHRVYYHDVAICANSQVSEELARQISVRNSEGRAGNFLFISQHDEHIHIIHSCAYSNRSCRCNYIWNGITVPYVLRRQSATRRHCRLFEYTDWYNVLLYTCSGGRNGIYYQVDCSNWRLCTGHGSVPAEEHSGEEPRHLVENEGLLSADPIFQRESDPLPRGANQTAHQCEPSSTKSEGDKIKAKIKSIKLQLLPVPLIDVVYCEEYLARPDVMYKRQRHVAVQDAADVVLAEINLMSIKDIYSLNINTPFRPRYHAIKVDRDDYYMSIEESLSAYKNLLLFQLGDYENVYHFCKQLFNVLNMSKPKRNTFIIVGEQCSGKNFFIDPITATIINVGYLGNPNKINNFAYQDCVNRRVIVWNELNYASEEVDTLKMILGGDVCPVRVKFRGDFVVHRTPVIILTNENLPLMNDPTFVNRIYVHTWRYCPQLVEYSKKCHPLTFFELCIKMGIMHV